MKTRFLFPHKYKLIGWIMLVPAAILGSIMIIGEWQPDFLTITIFSLSPETFIGENNHFYKNNIGNEIAAVLFTIGALLAGFSRQKNEDEYIASIRMESLLWAVYVNFALLILSMLLVYDSWYLVVMVYNMFTVLIIFLLRFNFMLYKNNKTIANEK